MKILFFVDDYSDGAGNVVRILANEFEKRSSIEPVVAVLNPHSPNNKLSKNIRTIECRMSDNKSRNKLLFFWRNIKSVRKIVAEIKPDRIISFLDNINTNVCLSLFFKRIPIIVSERSNPLAIKPYGQYRYLRSFAYLRANKISVQCGCFKDFMPLLKRKMIVTPNPVTAPSVTKDGYSISGPAKFISCARLAKIKQIDLMIEAFALIHSKYPDSQLTIYGEGPERKALESLIKNLDLTESIFLPGAIKDVYPELQSADIYLMTSFQEGFPNSLCEAMAIGLPTISFKCHDGLEEIVHNGIDGILVQKNSAEEMAKEGLNLLQSEKKRKTIGTEAKKISDKFGVDRICDLWLRNLR